MSWLKLEFDNSDDESFGGFYPNRPKIERAHQTGELSVMLHESGDAIAFMVGWDILEVRPDMRSLGYGETLAEHHIDQARSDDVCVLEIECKPLSSISFWKKMGFTMYSEDEDDWQVYAFNVLNKSFDLQGDLPQASVSLSFYPESKTWKPDTKPVNEFSPRAARVSSDKVALSERIICFNQFQKLGPDTVLGVIVGGEQVYLDKIYYDTAQEIGVQRDNLGTYYLDYILTS